MTLSQSEAAQLASYLEKSVPGFRSMTHIGKFSGGQSNPTYRVDAASGRYVLRSKPRGKLLQSAHAVDREYRVLAALRQTEVPVPKVLHLCEDPEVFGSIFYVMEFLHGRVFWDPALPELSVDDRSTAYDDLNRLLAAIHTVDPEAVGLSDFGRPGNYFERQFARWSKQYRATETETIDEMEELIGWLHTNMVPDDGRISLVHGDYRIDNVMFAPDAPRAIAVMDWELSTLGHPFADLAYQCMLWRWPGHTVFKGLGTADLSTLGIPEEQAYIDLYCRRTGISGIDNWPFYLAFGLFRLACIAQGVRKRVDDGTASNKKADEIGQLVRPLANCANDILNS
ncbi:phosphotransferase family protein [Hoeflea alexandrii]|uniref:phosphotransferase family protein n=1 Tax=Hoeflea alexandrii TaxID=288436 RepID=UPI0022AE9112|nr:phosphotransferase family protein [Hoeflea alexandrii]MCZ4291678.1 phosphotransferase family protein [Hoeflea alexandrii]